MRGVENPGVFCYSIKILFFAVGVICRRLVLLSDFVSPIA